MFVKRRKRRRLIANGPKKSGEKRRKLCDRGKKVKVY